MLLRRLLTYETLTRLGLLDIEYQRIKLSPITLHILEHKQHGLPGCNHTKSRATIVTLLIFIPENQTNPRLQSHASSNCSKNFRSFSKKRRRSCVFLRVDAAGDEDVGVAHAAAQNLNPTCVLADIATLATADVA